MRKVLKYFVFWRILLFIVAFFASYFISIRTGYLFVNYWGNFDGVHYLSIAQNGYVNQAVFFPLFPVLIKILSLGRWYFGAAILISNLAFLFSLYYLYKLLCLDYKKEKAWEVVTILLLFPTSFFFGAVYAESLFLLFLVLSFYLARRRKWLLAAISASLLVATRVVGIFIIPALIYEYWVQNKKFNPSLLLTSAFLFAYSMFNYFRWGDFLYFIHAHGELANGRSTTSVVLFPQTIYRYAKILFSVPVSYEWFIALLELSVFILVCYLLYLAWKNKVRVSYLIFSILAFLLPASSGTFSGLPRYVLILFPIFVAVGFLDAKIKRVWKIISMVLLIVLTMFFVRGYFVA